MYGQWYDHHGWMTGGGMFIAWIWMGILILIPFIMLYFTLKYLFGKNRNDRNDRVCPDPELPQISSPLDILKVSYARGDISREEFLQKRNDLLEK